MSPNSPCMTSVILESLRWLVAEYRVDGFRIDAGGVLARNESGVPSTRPTAVIAAIAADPVLAGRKIIVEPWDAGDGIGSPNYLNGKYPLSTALEWNPDHGRALRRFIFHGGAEHARAFCKAIRGNRNAFSSRPHGAAHGVNYISCHDGFSLADYVSYNARTNADGYDDATSHNHGAEGSTADAKIVARRAAQMRNLTLALVLSRGTPMLSMGCETGISKGGNNNCYNIDGSANHLASNASESELTKFTRSALALRKRESCLRGIDFYLGLQWHTSDGVDRESKKQYRRRSGAVSGRKSHRQKSSGVFGSESSNRAEESLVCWTVGILFCVFNAGKAGVGVTLPDGVEGKDTWYLVCDTRDDSGRFFFEEDLGVSGRRLSSTKTASPRSGETVFVRGNSARVYKLFGFPTC